MPTLRVRNTPDAPVAKPISAESSFGAGMVWPADGRPVSQTVNPSPSVLRDHGCIGSLYASPISGQRAWGLSSISAQPLTRGGSVRSSSATLPDHELARDLATRADRLLVALREELSGARAELRRQQADRRSADMIVGALEALRPATPCSSRTLLTTAAGSTAIGCGSSTLWTAPGSSGTQAVTTGLFTWPCGPVAAWWRGQWLCPQPEEIFSSRVAPSSS